MTAAALYRYNPGKGFSVANYPLLGNPHKHFYTTRNRPILMAVQHITAGSSDFDGVDTSAEGTVRYSASTDVVASYHGIVDSDSIIDCLPDSYTAFAQGVSGHNFNSPALSLEIGLRSPDWRKVPKAWRDKTIRNAARWWAPRVKQHGIPLRVMTDRNEIDRLIAAGKKVGFVEHGTLDPGRRSDAGFISPGVSTFPWALLFQYIREELGQKPAPSTPVKEELDVKVKNPLTGKLWEADDALWSIWTYTIQAAQDAKVARTLAEAAAKAGKPLTPEQVKAATEEALRSIIDEAQTQTTLVVDNSQEATQ